MFKITTLISILFLLTACGGGDGADRDDPNSLNLSGAGQKRARNGNISRDGSNVESMDLNRDEKPDQWIVSQSGSKRIERDLNFDGQVDVWQYPGEDGTIVDEEMDLDLDGNVDLVVFYKDGVVSTKEMSTDFSSITTVRAVCFESNATMTPTAMSTCGNTTKTISGFELGGTPTTTAPLMILTTSTDVRLSC